MGSPAGPSNPTPPPGPHRSLPGRLTEYLRQIAADRANKAITAAKAGARGRSATPLDDQWRIDNYWQQNGHSKGLTPRQRRRAEHKACRAFYRYDETSADGPGAGAAGIDVTAAPAHIPAA